MRPDSLLRLWRYINHLLTYLRRRNSQHRFDKRCPELSDKDCGTRKRNSPDLFYFILFYPEMWYVERCSMNGASVCFVRTWSWWTTSDHQRGFRDNSPAWTHCTVYLWSVRNSTTVYTVVQKWQPPRSAPSKVICFSYQFQSVYSVTHKSRHGHHPWQIKSAPINVQVLKNTNTNSNY